MAKKPEKRIFTYQTRLVVSAEQTAALDAYAALYGRAERSLFAAMAAGGDAGKLKSGFMNRFGLTARQFNAISISLKGKIASIQERRGGLITEAKSRIERADKVIAKLGKQQSGSNKLHQKKRRLATLQARLAGMIADDQAGKVRLCFGSKKLFRAQFNLAANGFTSDAEWAAAWRASRAEHFFVIGSKDETSGCQGCVASINAAGALDLRLRLPHCCAGAAGKHVLLQGLHFEYGHPQITDAIAHGVAISYRFLRDDKGWRVFVSCEAADVKTATQRAAGAIGVDLNADHLAISEMDRHGNWLQSDSVPLLTAGKDAAQAKATIGEAVKLVVLAALALGKPLVIEQLDFSKKKTELEAVRTERARGLSAFAYQQTLGMLKAAAFRSGVEIIQVNPAFTSTLGAVNHARRLGISIHAGAALCIARRGLGFSESPIVRTAAVPLRNGGHVTFDLPARNRSKHVWSFWSAVRRKSQAVVIQQVRLGQAKANPTPLSSAVRLTLCASRALPVRSRHANPPQHCSAGVLTDVPF